MNRFIAIALVLISGWCVRGTSAMGQDLPEQNRSAVGAAEWPVERVELLSGKTYQGLIESADGESEDGASDNGGWIHLIQVRRPRGRPMYLVIRPIARKAVAKVVRLDPDERARLRQRIDRYLNRARIEAARMDAVRLTVVGEDGNQYQHYHGTGFKLHSTVDEVTTRRIVVRIEQIFTAYRQILAPRAEPRQVESRRPLRVVILGSMDEYHAVLKRLGKDVENRACFIQDANLVVAGSELTRFAAMLAAVNARHEQIRAELDGLQKQLPVRLAAISAELRGQGVPDFHIAKLLRIKRSRFQKEIEQKQKELQRRNRENAEKFDEVTHRMFTRLYHEAFHAYLENYVYPHATHDVPRWLNEGLAMVCEEGLLEADTLRIDAPNAEVLQRLKDALDGPDSASLSQVLWAKGRTPVAGSDEDRFYIYSWGLAYYLTFEKHLLGSPALDRYVRQSSNDVAPAERFEQLVGMPIGQFEKTWREYIGELR